MLQTLSLGNIYYFWCAPTLTYQIAFPRAAFIQWPKVLRLSIQLVVCVVLVLFLVAQIVIPNLNNLVRDLDNSKGEVRAHVLGDYLLRMSIASTYIWLLGFFAFFHCFMNITAELLRFGDRIFYRDWWNASEVSAYWRLWNICPFIIGWFDTSTSHAFVLVSQRKVPHLLYSSFLLFYTRY